jgi:hypothetical protein
VADSRSSVKQRSDVEGGALWPEFRICGPAGNLVTWAAGADVASASFQAPSNGTYTVVVYDVSSGFAAVGDYRLDDTNTPRH